MILLILCILEDLNLVDDEKKIVRENVNDFLIFRNNCY